MLRCWAIVGEAREDPRVTVSLAVTPVTQSLPRSRSGITPVHHSDNAFGSYVLLRFVNIDVPQSGSDVAPEVAAAIGPDRAPRARGGDAPPGQPANPWPPRALAAPRATWKLLRSAPTSPASFPSSARERERPAEKMGTVGEPERPPVVRPDAYRPGPRFPRRRGSSAGSAAGGAGTRRRRSVSDRPSAAASCGGANAGQRVGTRGAAARAATSAGPIATVAGPKWRRPLPQFVRRPRRHGPGAPRRKDRLGVRPPLNSDHPIGG